MLILTIKITQIHTPLANDTKAEREAIKKSLQAAKEFDSVPNIQSKLDIISTLSKSKNKENANTQERLKLKYQRQQMKQNSPLPTYSVRRISKK